MLSHVWLLVTPWTVNCQASLSMGLSRQEYWSGSPFPPPGTILQWSNFSPIKILKKKGKYTEKKRERQRAASLRTKQIHWSTCYLWTLVPDCNGEGNGTPLQYSCLENPVDGGAWKAAVHGVVKSQTRLSDFWLLDHSSTWKHSLHF